MPPRSSAHAITTEDFIDHPEVQDCLRQLKQTFGENGRDFLISDVLDEEGHQYVNLVQKGGGVLGIALVGYTYILEQMGIRFIRLAGTSAGAINTSLMTVIGSYKDENDLLKGNKSIAKSEEILQVICNLNFFDLVDGHPTARWFIKKFITNKDFSTQLSRRIQTLFTLLFALPLLSFICLGLQYKISWMPAVTITLFIVTGIFILLCSVLGAYIIYMVKRLKDAGFGINPGDYFYDWIKSQLAHNHVTTVSDLIAVSETPVEGLYVRNQPNINTADLKGDVTFIASEIVSENKIEFPKMWNLFAKEKDLLQPAGFVRASMSIPIFFESYFINDIPCEEEEIKAAWRELSEKDPPSTASFVDGGILSNFPLNLFFNPNVKTPRLPSFGIDLNDEMLPKDVFTHTTTMQQVANREDEGKGADKWSIGGYLYRIFNTVRFYYDKDFLIKNSFFTKGIGTVPLKGYNWLNFFLTDEEKKEMFVLGAKAATKFLTEFDWEDYKNKGVSLRQHLSDTQSFSFSK